MIRPSERFKLTPVPMFNQGVSDEVQMHLRRFPPGNPPRPLLPARSGKFRDRAPKVITLEDGTLAVLQEGQPLERLISNISCGLPYEKSRPFDPLPGESYETSPGTGSPAQRLTEQAEDGVDAEVLFPGNVGPGFWRGIRNDDAYKAVVRAYNDWLAEEYCAYSPERLIGVGVTPITNIDDAVAELTHCQKIGLKTVIIDNFPAGNRYPTAADDRFWAAAVDLDMALTIHVEFGFPRRSRGPQADRRQRTVF
jgi:hypothetical protein